MLMGISMSWAQTIVGRHRELSFELAPNLM
jgi:hypothetical protein